MNTICTNSTPAAAWNRTIRSPPGAAQFVQHKIGSETRVSFKPNHNQPPLVVASTSAAAHSEPSTSSHASLVRACHQHPAATRHNPSSDSIIHSPPSTRNPNSTISSNSGHPDATQNRRAIELNQTSSAPPCSSLPFSVLDSRLHTFGETEIKTARCDHNC